MQYRTLGKTGIKVSPYCLGAMMFGKIGNADHDDSIRIIHKALDAGINFIDTADAYSQGESEEIVGKAVKDRRDSIVLATKAHRPMGDDPNMRGNSRRWLTRAVEDSLRRLGTDYIDLYQIHRPSPDTDIEETLSALTDLMRAGKVRAIGSSTFPVSEIIEAQWVAERRGLRASAPNSRPIRSWIAASSAKCSPPASATEWERWSGARWRRACSPAGTARASSSPTACASDTSPGRCPTNAGSTRSSNCFPSRRRRGCRSRIWRWPS